MERIIINTGNSVSGIVVGGRWQAVAKMLPETGVVIITDDNIFDIYGDGFPPFPVIKFKPGEKSKHLGTVSQIINELLEMGVDRTWFILGIGGGVVCDIAGFVASVYMRGIRFGFVSTSLMSQVDASVGGKNGVDAGQYKNVIGTFNQPEFVICDTTMLKSLPQDEYLSGFAELLKIGFIGDEGLVVIAEKNHKGFMERDRQLLTESVTRSVKFKGNVVAEDEKESGIRRILNFGHTYGHAIEMANGFQHGYGVAAGMELAIHLSNVKGLLSDSETARALSVLERYNIIPEYKISTDLMEKLVAHDKKKVDGGINFVLLTGIGKAVVEKMPLAELIDFYSQFIKKRGQ